MQKVIFELYEAEKLAAPGRATEELTDLWLEMLINFLLAEACVLEAMRLLLAVKADGRRLPHSLTLLDENGHTFATRWLSAYLVGQFTGRPDPSKHDSLLAYISHE